MEEHELTTCYKFIHSTSLVPYMYTDPMAGKCRADMATLDAVLAGYKQADRAPLLSKTHTEQWTTTTSDPGERQWLAERHMQGLEVKVAFCCRTAAAKTFKQGNMLCSFTSLLCLPKCQCRACTGFYFNMRFPWSALEHAVN